MKLIRKYFVILFFTLLTNYSNACDFPTGINVASILSTSASINWNTVTGATKYKVYYRIKGTTQWTIVISSSTTGIITGLSPSTMYQYKLKTVCGGVTSNFSPIKSFKTLATVLVPTPDHVVVFILENHGYEQIIDSAYAPNINAIANDSMSALFTQSYGLTHPSQPNYLHLFSGSDQGVTDDNIPASIPFKSPNLGRELINAGKTFITYSQNLPSVGFDGETSGNYARKHNPAANWMGTDTNGIPVATNQPFTTFPSNYDSLPTVCFVVPDQYHDMHNGTDPAKITIGDNWFYNNMQGYIQWARTHNSLLILTFDEDNSNYGNHITTIFFGPMVLHGSYSNHIDHYNVLRTVENMFGLNHAGNAANSTTITNCWVLPPRFTPNDSEHENTFDIEIFPNPATDFLNLIFNENTFAKNQLTIFDFKGISVLHKENIDNAAYLDISNLEKGIYFLQLISGDKLITKKFEKR